MNFHRSALAVLGALAALAVVVALNVQPAHAAPLGAGVLVAQHAAGQTVVHGANSGFTGERKLVEVKVTANFGNTETSSGFTFPSGLIHGCWLRVDTADTSETCDVGTDGSGSNDPDGFLDAASVNATGVIRGAFVSTVGANNTYVGAASTHTIGALVSYLIAGEDVTSGGDGVASHASAVTNGSDVLTYTCSAATNTWRGSIVCEYTDLTKGALNR